MAAMQNFAEIHLKPETLARYGLLEDWIARLENCCEDLRM
jgi:hypothetical protein